MTISQTLVLTCQQVNNNTNENNNEISFWQLSLYFSSRDVITQNELETEPLNMNQTRVILDMMKSIQISAKIIKITAKELLIPLTHVFQPFIFFWNYFR